MTRAGYQLTDIGAELEWGTFRDFLSNLPIDSALHNELHPEFSAWATRAKTNGILADIYDVLSDIRYALITIGGGKPHKPKPYPRPITKEPDNVKHFGQGGGLPPDELRAWFEKKRKENASSSIGDP